MATELVNSPYLDRPINTAWFPGVGIDATLTNKHNIEAMADPTIQLDARGKVKVLKVSDPEVREVLVPVQEDDTLEEPVDLDIIQELTEELEEEFNKLLASDKIRYNQWVQFHETYQRTHGIAGTSSQIICYISDLNKPAIPPEVAKEELTNIDIDEEQVQIIKMVDKDGKMVKKVSPY